MTKYLLLAILAAIAFSVWFANLRRRREEKRDPTLLHRERLLLRVRLDELLSTTRGILTSERILRESSRWFLSRRDSQVAQLKDIHSISWQVQMNFWLLLFAALIFGIYSSLGLLLIIYALQTPVVAVGFQSHFLPTSLFARVGLGVARSQIVFRAGKRDQYPQLEQLYQAGLNAWSKVRQPDAATTSTEPEELVSKPEIVPLFAWSSTVWLAVGSVFLLAHIQRVATGHVVLDHFLFGAFYVALPLAVGFIDGTRSGLWAALLTFLMLLAVKFPAGFLLGWAINDGAFHFVEAVWLFSALVLMVALGSTLNRGRLGPLPGEVAILLILPLAMNLLDPGSISSFRTLALVVLATGFCRLCAIAIPATLASRWLKATTRFLQNVVEFVWGPA